MGRRLLEVSDPVELLHDGDPIVAQRGEPIAAALLAADRPGLSRGPKLHRPRGPYCFRGACDGCLARVDGEPNVMTCLRPVSGGESVETQNVVGTRQVDLLRTTDFLFPQGMDHHRLFAGVRGVSSLVQNVARRVAGLGRLPDIEPTAPLAQRLQAPVLIVGGGTAGLAAAASLGQAALLADEGLALGGAAALLQPTRSAELVAKAERAGARLLRQTSVIGIFRESEQARPKALLVGASGSSLVESDLLLLAPGRHDPVALFGNNDLPGIHSARAALALLGRNIAVGDRVLLVGAGRFADAFAAAARAALDVLRCTPEELVAATGRSRVRGAVLRSNRWPERVRVSSIVVDGAGPPVHELAVQAGARAHFDAEHGYLLELAADGQVAERVFVAGGAAACAAGSELDGQRVAGHVLRKLALA